MARVRLGAAAFFVAMIATTCARVAQADEPATFEAVTSTRAAVADHLRLTGFAVGDLPLDLGVARAPRLYIWDPVCWERALPVTNMGVASALFVLNYDW